MMITIMMIRKLRKAPWSGHLEENRCLDRICPIYTQHIICFWNPWNQDYNLGVFPVIMITIMMIRKLRECPWRGHLEENWCLDGIFLIYNQHIICFRNPCNQDYNLGVVPVIVLWVGNSHWHGSIWFGSDNSRADQTVAARWPHDRVVVWTYGYLWKALDVNNTILGTRSILGGTRGGNFLYIKGTWMVQNMWGSWLYSVQGCGVNRCAFFFLNIHDRIKSHKRNIFYLIFMIFGSFQILISTYDFRDMEFMYFHKYINFISQ